jgi:hypothetical protein
LSEDGDVHSGASDRSQSILTRWRVRAAEEFTPRCFIGEHPQLLVLPTHHAAAGLLCSNIGLAFSEFSSEEFTRSVSWRMTLLLRDLPAHHSAT